MGYRRQWLAGDLWAGLALTALLVPQGMAYAQLAGLPPVTGLYTTVLGLIAYAAFGPSRIMVLGPDSSLGPLIAAIVLPLAGGDPGRAIALASVLAILMGLISVGAGIARIGTIAELLSKPVRVGYLGGLALVVLASQLPKVFGISSSADTTLGAFGDFFQAVAAGATNPTALAIGLASLGVILVSRKWAPAVPGVLLAVVGSTLAVVWLGLDEAGTSLVGAVPEGLPIPTLPVIGLADTGTLVVGALGVAFVTLADTSALSRALAAERGETVDPNQEMVALGVANVAVGFFQGFPLSASSSRTAVAKVAGAHTQLTGLIGAGAIAVLLTFGNRLTTSMPTASLAAVVIAAAFSLFDLDEMRWLWRVRRSEFGLSMAALAGVVVVGVLEGIVVAILISLGTFIWRAWRPHDAVLGRVPGQKGYHDLLRHPEGSRIPGLVIYRFDAPLFFANADHFARRVRAAIAERKDRIDWVVVAAEPVTDIDTTGAEVLDQLVRELKSQGVTLAFAELKGPVKDRLRSYQMYPTIGDGMFFPTLGTAVDGFLAASGITWTDPVDGPRSAITPGG
jgi:high affinity sulfate transporter 1